MADARHGQDHPTGLLELDIQPRGAREKGLFRRFLAGLRSIAGTDRRILREAKMFREKASKGGQAVLERPAVANRLALSQIRQNLADVRLKNAQAEKLAAETAQLQIKTKIDWNDAALRWIKDLEARGFVAVPCMDGDMVTVVISDPNRILMPASPRAPKDR